MKLDVILAFQLDPKILLKTILFLQTFSSMHD